MTGFGEARTQDALGSIHVEIRAVNNRHLKVNLKVSESHSRFEPDVEALVRESIRRGTVTIHVRVDRPRRLEDYKLNFVALESYRKQLSNFESTDRVDLGALLALPGVVEDQRTRDNEPEPEWEGLRNALTAALERFNASRTAEGKAMAAELKSLARGVAGNLARIVDRAPEVVQEYQTRLLERVAALLREQAVALEPRDVAREVALLADRVDIAEEIVRLRAHIEHYHNLIDEPSSSGRKLEFLIQEMGREINTIGSKANDVEIARSVVEIKAILEKIRELVQNVE